MWATITKPFALFMLWLYELTGNYGIALILFALAVNLVLTPFMAKSKKGMMRMTRMQPKMKELQKRHEGNPQKLQQEMQKLYKEEGASPTGGCLWSLIPFPILIALYAVIRQPLTRMMYLASDAVSELSEFCSTLGYTAASSTRAAAYEEIRLADFIHQNWDAVSAQFPALDKLVNLDFSFLTMNLGQQPNWQFLWNGPEEGTTWMAAFLLFLVPFVSAGLSWVSMKVANLANPTAEVDTQAAATTKSMTMMMPLMSIWICFVMPGAMGIYWIANSVFGMARDFVLTKIYKKQLDREDSERITAAALREKEIADRHEETERLRAEGRTEVNVNTNKKKIQASEKQKREERRAALEKAERAARRERLGIQESEKPASQVGERRFARGRAYVPDRFSNPEAAEEATLLAAEAAEAYEALEESEELEVTEAVEEAVELPEAVESEMEEAAEEVVEAAEEIVPEVEEAKEEPVSEEE